MELREGKYANNNFNMSRVIRNAQIYEDIKKTEINNFKIKSNAMVIGNQEEKIDVEKIKKILDTKYNKMPQRRSIRLMDSEVNITEPQEISTKEYDINSILTKAKDKKAETYEEVRVKKLRDTQYEILNSLELNDNNQSKTSDDDLMELINTITINEEKIKDGTKASLKELEDLTINDKEEKIEKVENKDNKIDNSFYTTNNLFNENDFENEDKEEENKLKKGVKILIVILIIVFLIGLIIFLKSYLNTK